MNIVVLDNDELVPGVEFPALKAERYGWIQYPRLAAAEIAPTCWRSHIIVSIATPLETPCLAELKLLQLLIVGQSVEKLVDPLVLQARGIPYLQVTDVDWTQPQAAQQGCDRIIAEIDDFLLHQQTSA